MDSAYTPTDGDLRLGGPSHVLLKIVCFADVLQGEWSYLLDSLVGFLQASAKGLNPEFNALLEAANACRELVDCLPSSPSDRGPV